jgi:predicted GNAT superfamily acetyltransferase
MAKATSDPTIVLRDLESIDDLRQVPGVEHAVWGGNDRDTVPVLLLIAAKEAGSILIGAFDGERLVGFTFGFPGLERGQVSIHSHMTAVLPGYRDLNLGYKLKLAQRERTLAAGVRCITWTFDPLQSRNAHFNFAKLGVVSDRYKVDFYGRESTSTLHQNGTDRLWVTWALDSERVQQRLQGADAAVKGAVQEVLLVRCDANQRPVPGDVGDVHSHDVLGLQIPSDIMTIEQNDPGLAWAWREVTRSAFTTCLRGGFFVADFVRGSAGTAGSYLLRKGSMLES